MDKNAIQQLEQQVDELLRSQLIEKTDVARSRIEKMVSRLRELDSEL